MKHPGFGCTVMAMHKGKIILFCILIGITVIAPSACKNQKVSTITPTPILVPTVSMASTITTSQVWYDGNTEAYWYENLKGEVIITANGNQYVETIQTNNVARLLGPSSSNETKVRIAYKIDKVPNEYIEITESNSTPQLVPNQDDLEYIYLDFDNTKLLEE